MIEELEKVNVAGYEFLIYHKRIEEIRKKIDDILMLGSLLGYKIDITNHYYKINMICRFKRDNLNGRSLYLLSITLNEEIGEFEDCYIHYMNKLGRVDIDNLANNSFVGILDKTINMMD